MNPTQTIHNNSKTSKQYTSSKENTVLSFNWLFDHCIVSFSDM